MTAKSDRKLTNDENRGIAQQVREELARRRISRQRLADEARISISTLEKALSGRRTFTLGSIVRIEEALGIKLRRTGVANGSDAENNGVAPDELGNYSRASVAWIIGSFLTVRPSFGEKSAVYAYRTEIFWDETNASLAFREAERIDQDFTQFGTVSVPSQTGHIYLITNRHGQYRLIVVARPAITGEMHGILTTLQAGKGSQLTPTSAPIVMVPIKSGEKAVFGRIPQGHTSYASYRGLLKRTLDDSFASFILT
jgi:transcriptional regulator with XRE-family HTH domain